MTAGSMICFSIYILVALIMFGIGVSQQKSKTPVGFYTGEKPTTKHELPCVSLWNKTHGFAHWRRGGACCLDDLVSSLFGQVV